jgi:hypothetical protein
MMAPLTTIAPSSSETSCTILNRPGKASLSSAFPAMTQQERQRRTLSFSSTVDVHEVLHVGDFSLDEIRSSWYSHKEIKVMKKRSKRIATQSEKENDENDYCLRGLETKTVRGSSQKRQRKSTARKAVFLEQRRQQEQGLENPEAIAEAYYDCTDYCQATAHMMGLRDALMAPNNNTNNKEEDERLSGRYPCRHRPIILQVRRENLRQVSSSAA